MPCIKRLRYLELVKETTFGERIYTEVNATASKFMNNSINPASDTRMYDDTGLTGGDEDVAEGLYSASGDSVGKMELDFIGNIFMGGLGEVITTGAGPTYTHEFIRTHCSRLPSYQIHKGQDLIEYIGYGSTINSWSMTTDVGSWLEVTTNWICASDGDEDIKQEEDLPLVVTKPMVFHNVTSHTVGGVDEMLNLVSMTIDGNNNVSLEDGYNVGNIISEYAVAGKREITANLKYKYKGTGKKELQDRWGASDGPSTNVTKKDYTFGFADTFGNTLELLMPVGVMESPVISPSGIDELYVEVKVKFIIGNVTLADAITVKKTEILATLVNDKASY